MYPHIVEDGQDVSDGATVDVLEVVIAALGKDESVALLLKKKAFNEMLQFGIISCLIKDSCKAVRVFSPGNITIVVCLISQNHLGKAFSEIANQWKIRKITSSISSESVL